MFAPVILATWEAENWEEDHGSSPVWVKSLRDRISTSSWAGGMHLSC
jgi:hypothetical protein